MTAPRALLLGWADLLRPRIFRLVLLGIALTILLFVALQAGLFWALRLFGPDSVTLPFWGAIPLGGALSWGSLAMFPVLGFFLMAPVAAAFAGLFSDRVANRVEEIHYPNARGAEPDFWDGLLESLAVMGLVLLVGLCSLLLTPFVGPLAPVLFYIANGWLLGREFFQMAARRHLPETEATRLRNARTVTVTALGVMIAFALTIPVVNIAVPVLAVASFTHLYHLLSGPAGRAA
ncbi:EI24 domain-containing protein [Paracoccus sp. S1E-3]|uniref:EI24 domain-containing protein n=1 Tax=Paracoccus sp. S1E-3 TaxID=2756130 RepID=UPI0015EF3086|nr:EI24 domain-containing protein [Paracoccus sp. S1E-3]MBA4490349.1 EI24 domain-containing protein [Paracoccus sp. S1E-3]